MEKIEIMIVIIIKHNFVIGVIKELYLNLLFSVLKYQI